MFLSQLLSSATVVRAAIDDVTNGTTMFQQNFIYKNGDGSDVSHNPELAVS